MGNECRLINKDCLEYMKTLVDNYFDLIITDPPYGINIAKEGNIGGKNLAKPKDYGKCEWDFKIPSEEYFKEMFRVSRNQIIFGGNYFVEHLKNSPCWIVWDKDNTGNFADCELLWTSFDSAVRKIKFRWNGMLQERMNWKEERIHPTQKPVALIRKILNKYKVVPEGGIVFDPFAGSGSILIACKQLGIDSIGCEADKKHFDDATKRINKEKEQTSLCIGKEQSNG